MTTTPYTNTTALAAVDGEDIATIHASDMADTLASYARSVALVVDRSDLHVLLRALKSIPEDAEYDADVAQRLHLAIQGSLDGGLR